MGFQQHYEQQVVKMKNYQFSDGIFSMNYLLTIQK